MTVWRQDVLGAGFECTDLDLGTDVEGPLVATLVRALPRRPGVLARMFHGKRPLEDIDVLYVHGWSDYFFQRDLAHFWTSRGARFFALDLRKYGRSLRQGQTAGYIANLDDYGQEIGLALDVIAEAAGKGHQRRLVLLGHSTGGLVLSLWAAKHPGRAAAVILNSPWLEFQLKGAGRQFFAPIVKFGATLNPREVAPQLDYGYYSRAQREVGPVADLAGVNHEWRPDRSHAVLSGWLNAILEGHNRVAAGLSIAEPILVMLSARSVTPLRWSEELTEVDSVLDVEAVATAALRLGSSVTVERVHGALHDLFISNEVARADAYARLERWIVGWSAAQRVE